MENEIIFFTKTPFKIVIAARPKTGSAIIWRSRESRWGISPHDYFQIISDFYYEEISQAEAQSVYQDVEPDIALLDHLDNLRRGATNERQP